MAMDMRRSPFGCGDWIQARPGGADILVLDGHWAHALSVIQALGQSRLWRMHVLAFADQTEEPIHLSRHVSSFRNLGKMNREEDLIAGIEAAAIAVSARVILPLSEPTTLSCIRHRERLEKVASLPPLPDAATFSAAVDKASLAGRLLRHGLPAPSSWVHPEGSPLPEASPGLEYPLVVKPSRGEFGYGIKRANDAAEFGRVMESFGVSAAFVVQEWVPGQDVDCSVLAVEGRIVAHTIQQGMAPPDRDFAPAKRLQFVDDEKVLNVVRRLVAALGWSGIAHIDLRRDERTGEPLILEINARIWGSLLASVAVGVNFPELMCRAALGLTLPTTPQQPGRFNTQGLGIRSILRGLRRQADGFKFRETSLPFILGDPLPVLLRECTMRMKRLCRVGRRG